MHEETSIAISRPTSTTKQETKVAQLDTPLFDPYGLSSSLSSDHLSASPALDASELSEVAARRILGVASTAGRPTSSPQSPPHARLGANGRRRRSSPDPEVSGPFSFPESQSAGRNWWERGNTGDVGPGGDTAQMSAAKVGESDPDESAASVGQYERRQSPFSVRSSARSRPALTIGADAAESEKHPEDQPSCLRSPAADFLSSFGSMNSVAKSNLPKSHSVSPRKPSTAEHGFFAPSNHFRVFSDSSPLLGWDGPHRTSNLFDRRAPAVQENFPVVRVRPDEEGGRIGPEGRYLLGKTIGFGGFSTVREGWDTSRDEPHRVAIKLVYSEPSNGNTAQATPQSSPLEVSLWHSLHAHPHLLPLLHYERLVIDRLDLERGRSTTADSEGSYVDALVMPFCDQGSLLNFVRKEGGRRGSDASRRPSVENFRSNSKAAENGAGLPMDRTGSGFLHRSVTLGPGERVSRAVSHNVASKPSHPATGSIATYAAQPVPEVGSLGRASSLSGGSNFGIRRASSSRSTARPRSEGVSVHSAQEILHQLASAISTLHEQARVLHGDLKLDNVLGQSTTPTTLSSEGVCWRVADFGLARKVDEVEDTENAERIRNLKLHADSLDSASHTLPRSAGRQVKSNRVAESASYLAGARQVLGVGGSLAYTPPEVLKSPALPGSNNERLVSHQEPTSPFARDMWALGCILYALLSGRLPFADSFEPRLQLKITRAQWEFPPRLHRRAERLARSAADVSGSRRPSLTSPTSATQRERSGSVGFQHSQLGSQNGSYISSNGAQALRSRSIVSPTIDMSASLPSLRPLEYSHGRHVSAASSRGLTSNTSSQRNHIVGSAPSGPDDAALSATTHSHADVDAEAFARAAGTADPDSDEEEGFDGDWDGNSEMRAAAREVLCGLLEPDPARRWTIERLSSCRWLTALRPVSETPFVRKDILSSSSEVVTSEPSDEDIGEGAVGARRSVESIRKEMGDSKKSAPVPVPMPSPSAGREATSYFPSPKIRDRMPWDQNDGVALRGRWGGVADEHGRARSTSRGRSHRSPSRGAIDRLRTPVEGGQDSQARYSEMALAAAQHTVLSRHRSDLDGGHEHGWGGRAATPSSEEEGEDSTADPPRGRRRMIALDEDDAVRTWESSRGAGGAYVPAKPIAIRTASASPMRARRSLSSRGRTSDGHSPDPTQRHRGRSSSARPSPISPDRGSPAPSLRVMQSSASVGGNLSTGTTNDSSAALSMFNARRDRTSTSRSRSRAPDTLVHILNQDRERSASSGKKEGSSERERSRSRMDKGKRMTEEEEAEGPTGQQQEEGDGRWWERGRARLPRNAS